MATLYQHGLTLSEGQMKKLAGVIKKPEALQLKLTKEALTGDHNLLLTQTQITALTRAKEKGTGAVLSLSKRQISEMKKQMKAGGFLPFLIPLLASAASAALSAGVSYGVNKAIQKAEGKGNDKLIAPGLTPSDTMQMRIQKKKLAPQLTAQEVKATGLFQFGVPYQKTPAATKTGSGLVPFGLSPRT